MAEGQEKDGTLELDGFPDLAVAGSNLVLTEDVDGVGVEAPSGENTGYMIWAEEKTDILVKP
jgi:hypothetical protein